MAAESSRELPTFVAAVTIRCCARELHQGATPSCGKPARWQRGPASDATAFYCDRHMQPGDRALAGVVLVRRVSIVCEVVFTATEHGAAAARAEALDRLIEAAHQVGGAVNLQSTTTALGHYVAPAPDGGRNASRLGAK